MKPKSIEKVLVTGGAGFIGSHVVDQLIEADYDTFVLDCLEEQVHRESRKPTYLNPNAHFILGNVVDRPLLDSVLSQVDAVIHLASVVGVGQSMYQIYRYIDSNTSGTAMLLDSMVNTSNQIMKLIIASSMSIYGEGKYYCNHCSSTVYPTSRSLSQLKSGKWDYTCDSCNSPLTHQPTDENTPLSPTSIYGMSKRHQEEMSLLVGKTYGIPTVALRFFNVYGPRQALSNPYTGAGAIFLSRILSGKPPYIFEDGGQIRDFVHVKDVARAILLALERSNVSYQSINVASGKPATIIQLAETLIQLCGAEMKPHVSGEFRKGDIRHCYADTTRLRELLQFEPKINFRDGLAELVEWGKNHGWASSNSFEQALGELRQKKLM